MLFSIAYLALFVQVTICAILAVKATQFGQKLKTVLALLLAVASCSLSLAVRLSFAAENATQTFIIESATIWLFALGIGLLASQYRKVRK